LSRKGAGCHCNEHGKCDCCFFHHSIPLCHCLCPKR
jgi:hypothetical protein